MKKADIAGLSNAVQQLGISASRSGDAGDGNRAGGPISKDAAEQIARQVGTCHSLLFFKLTDGFAVLRIAMGPAFLSVRT